MSIIRSTVEIYKEQACTTFIQSVVKNSAPFNTIEVTGLDKGAEFWARAQVRDDSNLDSNWSTPYQFYTLPNVVYFNNTHPSYGDDWIDAQLDSETTDVTISTYGLEASTSSSFSNPIRATDSQGAPVITGLSEHTTYYVRPYIIDQFNREYINTSATETVTTRYSTPIVQWTGMSSVGPSTWTNQITVTSTSAVSAVTVRYEVAGSGVVQTLSLTAQTGPQNVSLTGLTPNTSYTVNVIATNAGGNGQSTIQSFTTGSASVTAEVLSASADNSRPHIAFSGRAAAGDASVTLTGIYADLYTNNTHTGAAVESVTGSSPFTSISNNFDHANTDTQYYVFIRSTYTVSGDVNPHIAWSAAYPVRTYSSFSFGQITPTNNSCSIAYSVSGVATSIEMAYSTDQLNWTTIPVSSMSGGTVNVTGLTPNTTYYLRGKCLSTAGWSAYETTSFQTTNALPVVTVTSISNITPVSATVNLSIV